MPKPNVWPVVHEERQSLASDLGQLTEDKWPTPSLCANWSVRDVLAHMTSTASMGTTDFVSKIVSSGFSLTRLQEKDIAAIRGDNPAETLAAFEACAGSSKHPPGPSDTWLGETIVHAEDIRRPLGIAHSYPIDSVVQVVDFYKGSNLVIGAKRRISGLSLRATDADWSHGSGPEVSGPVVALLMAMAGRKAALTDLEGEGVAVLDGRP